MGNLVTERSRNEILPLGSQKSLPNGNLSMKRRSTKTMKKRELKSILQRLQTLELIVVIHQTFTYQKMCQYKGLLE